MWLIVQENCNKMLHPSVKFKLFPQLDCLQSNTTCLDSVFSSCQRLQCLAYVMRQTTAVLFTCIIINYPLVSVHLIPNSPEHSGKCRWSLSPWHSHQGQTFLPSHPMISGLLFFYGDFAIVSLWNLSALSTVWLPMKAGIVIFLVEQHSRQWKVQIV